MPEYYIRFYNMADQQGCDNGRYNNAHDTIFLWKQIDKEKRENQIDYSFHHRLPAIIVEGAGGIPKKQGCGSHVLCKLVQGDNKDDGM